jgi:hypothetical protein
MSASIHRLIYYCRTYSWMLDPRFLLPKGDFPLDRPIFLLGTQGGGLTLLSRMLRRHPEVVSVAGNHRYWTSADEMQNTFGMFLPSEFSGIRYKAPPHPDLPPPRSWTYATDELLPVYRQRAEDATPELGKAFLDAIRFAVTRHARDRGRARFLDKSQSYSVRVGLIHKVLAGFDPRFVLVVREPYISVYRAATGKAADMKRLAKTHSYEERVTLCAQHYANSMKAVYADCDELGIKLHLVRFEDLLKEPDRRLREVCDFVDLDFRPDMLPAAGHQFPIGSRFLNRWYPIRPDVNSAYDPRLDPFLIHTVNATFGDLSEQMGYERRGI